MTDLAEVTPMPPRTDAEKRDAARELASANPQLTSAEVGEQFGMGEKWGQMRRAEAGVTGKRKGKRRRTVSQPHPTPSDTTPARHTARRTASAKRTTMTVTAVGLAVVVLAPVVLSFHSLAGWGHDALALNWPLTYVVPLTLDAAALTCVGLTFHATLRADSAGAARLLIWVFAAASSLANWRHGATISPDAAIFYAAMPGIAALLLELALRLVRRSVLAGIGALERPLPRYRVARWLVAPIETWGAWRAAVCEGITDPKAAIAHQRAKKARKGGPS